VTVADAKNFGMTGAGTFGTGTAAVSLNGDITVASGKNFAMTGAGTMGSGTGAVSLNGATTVTGTNAFTTGTGTTTLKGAVSVDAGVDITAAGAGSDINYALSTTGIFTTPGGAVTIGPGAIGVTGDITQAANKGILSLAGTGAYDFGVATGIFRTSTGANTLMGDVTVTGAKTFTTGTGAVGLNGDVTVASGKNFAQAGAGTFGTGSGTNSLNGNVVLAADKSITMSGTAALTTGSGAVALNGPVTISGINTLATGTGAVSLNGHTTIAADKNLIMSGTGTITGAEHIASADDIFVADDLVVDGLARIDEGLTVGSVASNGTISGTSITVSATIQGEQVTSTDDMLVFGDLVANTGVINTTLDVNGATTTAALTVDASSVLTADRFTGRITTTAANVTILDSGTDIWKVGNATAPNTQTITFPTVADNVGRIITVAVATDPGDNTVIVKGEAAENIDGANTKTCTDVVGSFYTVVSNGIAWIKVASSGTWT